MLVVAVLMAYFALSPSGVLHAVPPDDFDEFVDKEIKLGMPDGTTNNVLFNMRVLFGIRDGNSLHCKEKYGWRNFESDLSVPWLEDKTGKQMYLFGKVEDFIGIIITDYNSKSDTQKENMVKELQKVLPTYDKKTGQLRSSKPSYQGWRWIARPRDARATVLCVDPTSKWAVPAETLPPAPPPPVAQTLVVNTLIEQRDASQAALAEQREANTDLASAHAALEIELRDVKRQRDEAMLIINTPAPSKRQAGAMVLFAPPQGGLITPALTGSASTSVGTLAVGNTPTLTFTAGNGKNVTYLRAVCSGRGTESLSDRQQGRQADAISSFLEIQSGGGEANVLALLAAHKRQHKVLRLKIPLMPYVPSPLNVCYDILISLINLPLFPMPRLSTPSSTLPGSSVQRRRQHLALRALGVWLRHRGCT